MYHLEHHLNRCTIWNMTTTSASQIEINASLERVWEVLVDVESWPDWTTSMTSVNRLDSGPLRVGSTARIEQPNLPTMVWRVTELVPQQQFSWESKLPGLLITGKHAVTELAPGRVRLELAAIGSGLLAGIADRISGKRTRDYVELEAAGMKAAAESAEPAAEAEQSNPAANAW